MVIINLFTQPRSYQDGLAMAMQLKDVAFSRQASFWRENCHKFAWKVRFWSSRLLKVHNIPEFCSCQEAETCRYIQNDKQNGLFTIPLPLPVQRKSRADPRKKPLEEQSDCVKKRKIYCTLVLCMIKNLLLLTLSTCSPNLARWAIRRFHDSEVLV